MTILRRVALCAGAVIGFVWGTRRGRNRQRDRHRGHRRVSAPAGMRLCFDLDNTLCRTDGVDYANAQPLMGRIARVAEHYHKGDHITINTARGSGSQTWQNGDLRALTAKQLREWGVPYHVLRVGQKPVADVYVDDRGVSDKEFFG